MNGHVYIPEARRRVLLLITEQQIKPNEHWSDHEHSYQERYKLSCCKCYLYNAHIY